MMADRSRIFGTSPYFALPTAPIITFFRCLRSTKRRNSSNNVSVVQKDNRPPFFGSFPGGVKVMNAILLFICIYYLVNYI